ncbi:MAG: 7TM domain-containing protein [Bacteroidota bacterium]
MINSKSYLGAAILLLIIPLASMGLKYHKSAKSVNDLLPKDVYQVTYEFDMSNLGPDAFTKAYLPESNERQAIGPFSHAGDTLDFKALDTEDGIRGIWRTANEQEVVFQLSFEMEGKAIHFDLPSDLGFEASFDETINPFLQASPKIQAGDPVIVDLANSLKTDNIKQTIKANFDYVDKITVSNTGVLTDALTALNRNRASCNGKSRLFVALCRAQGIPARVVGGIIMETGRKRTSHLWAEIYSQGHWIPFDVLNHHFAMLPAHYMEIYKGDNFLITHTPDIGYDYQFVIDKKFQSAASSSASVFQLWPLLGQAGVPMGLLSGILLLPVAALLIAILRNVVGLKPIGIFLPALIALALVKVSFIWGILAFGIVILSVSLLHFHLENWGLLHIPKTMIMLTCVIVTLLLFSKAGLYVGEENLSLAMFLPIVVLSITAERFAKTLVEENIQEAMKLLGTTFFVALLCYPIFSSEFLLGFMMTYPETYFIILFILLLLGRWIGMRILEYRRFSELSQQPAF